MVAQDLAAERGDDPSTWLREGSRQGFAPGLIPDTFRPTNRPTFQQVLEFARDSTFRVCHKPVAACSRCFFIACDQAGEPKQQKTYVRDKVNMGNKVTGSCLCGNSNIILIATT